MQLTASGALPGEAIRPRPLSLTDARVLRLAALSVIVLLAAGLRLANLPALGYVNHYYTAAVASMLQSWHNFFFVAAEPGGAVSVDKPPVGLWLQTVSALVLGINGLAVVLPQILAGIVSVALLYHLVRRWFGTPAGLLAALALAITPVVVATDRNNTIDSTLILTLLLAAWAFSRASQSGRARYVLLGAGLVGIGFNIKMLEAFLPLPAFYAMYLLGSPERWRRKVANLTVATVLLLVISLSWITAVDLTPAAQRPYVGSSGDNSELTLAIGYNGLQRLSGMGRQLQGGLGAIVGRLLPGGNGRPARGGPGGGAGPGGGLAPFGVAAFPGTGQPGLARLFQPPLAKDAGWLLPFSLFAVGLLVAGTRLHRPLARPQQAALLWGGWLLTAGLFFSVAGFFHEYYLAIIGPPVAALFGIGASALWRLGRSRPWLAMNLLLIAAGVTLALQLVTATAFVNLAWWLLIPTALFVVGAAVLLVVTGSGRSRASRAGFSCVLAALLVAPGVWSALTSANPSANQSLPAAFGGQASAPGRYAGLQVNPTLLSFLLANTQGQKYLAAVPSSMQGADYVIATGRPVLYLGGFMGADRVASPADLDQLVTTGQLRYIYWDVRGRGGFGQQPNIAGWVNQNCRLVPGFDANTANAGTPDGLGARVGDAPGLSAGGSLSVSLYDCTH